ncbi:MAG: methyltransferase domain-containing protein [Burkholderiales bacterium]
MDTKRTLDKLDKTALRRTFGRLAPAYLSTAQVQSEICQRMLARMELVRIDPAVILDAGAGPGIAARSMAVRYPRATTIALDISCDMLRQIPRPGRLPAWLGGSKEPAVRALCADFEHLPLGSASVDCVVSNLALAWAEDLARALAELHRVLKPGGLLMFSTLGPDTLLEWGSQRTPAMTQRLADMHDLGDLLSHLGYAGPVMDQEHLRLTYSHVSKLLADLKHWGALNLTADRPRGLSGRRRVANISGENATLEVVYGHAWKPGAAASHRMKDGRSVIRFVGKN